MSGGTDTGRVSYAPMTGREALATLLEVRRSMARAPSFNGICSAMRWAANTTTSCKAVGHWLRHHFPLWDEYSGVMDYPVPCPDGGDPEVAYDNASQHDMWRLTHPYGAARQRLLSFLIAKAEAQMHFEGETL